LTGFTVLGLVVLFLGCRPTGEPAPAGGQTGAAEPAAQQSFDVDSGPYTAGKKVMVANNCFRCHGINGVRGPMASGPPPASGGRPRMGRGPDLGKVGAEPDHTAEWLVAHVRDPKSHNPDSMMPGFDGKINDDDLRALGEYLASLK
jgi:cbb3-type cytochrome oxidase cytochrome c subunit